MRLSGPRFQKAPKSRGARLPIAARALTALVGGYAAAAGIAALGARLLPIARSEATAWGMILSFLIYAMIGLWAFHEPRLRVVVVAIWGSAAITIAAVLLIGVRA